MYKDIEVVSTTSSCLSQDREKDNSHGRTIIREMEVFDASLGTKTKEWAALTTYIKLKRQINDHKNQTTTFETAYFISDMKLTAKEFQKGIRGHWAIENKLHWVKDVVHKEDKNAIRCGNGPIATSIFSSIAINIHRKNGNQSITDAQMEAAVNVKDFAIRLRT